MFLSHPQSQQPKGLELILLPYITEKINFLDSIPVLPHQLYAFTDEMQLLHPGVSFDYSLLEELGGRNLWFLDVLHN